MSDSIVHARPPFPVLRPTTEADCFDVKNCVDSRRNTDYVLLTQRHWSFGQKFIREVQTRGVGKLVELCSEVRGEKHIYDGDGRCNIYTDRTERDR